jgi:hypothetical protein
MAHAVGHISVRHFNPAVTLGLWASGRCANRHVVPYILAQRVGAIAAGALCLIAPGKAGWFRLFAGGEYVGQFWLAPIAGALLAGALAKWLYEDRRIYDTVVIEKRAARRRAGSAVRPRSCADDGGPDPIGAPARGRSCMREGDPGREGARKSARLAEARGGGCRHSKAQESLEVRMAETEEVE